MGANVGFVSTQLAQMLAARSPTIYAFEPVPTTFAKLVQTVHRLGLNDRVHPIPAAVLDDPRQVCLSYSLRNSLYAQITPHGLNPRVGDHLAYAPGVTLDGFCSLEGASEDRRRGQRSGRLTWRATAALAERQTRYSP